MCDRATTPPPTRAQCYCYTRRGIAAVLAAAGVVVLAWLVPSFMVVAFVAAAVAAVGIVGLAVSRGGGLTLLHRYTPPVPEPARVTLESPPEAWWEQSRFSDLAAQEEGRRRPSPPAHPSSAHLN